MIINQQPPSAGGSSSATHTLTIDSTIFSNGHTIEVYDQLTGNWISNPSHITFEAGQVLLQRCYGLFDTRVCVNDECEFGYDTPLQIDSASNYSYNLVAWHMPDADVSIHYYGGGGSGN